MRVSEAGMSRFPQLEHEWGSVVRALREGQPVDLAECTRTLGALVEYTLCDVLRAEEETRRYWVDGVLFQQIDLESAARVQARAVAWCADARTEWQVPMRMLAVFTEHPPFRMSTLTLCLGDARLPDLRAHGGPKGRKLAAPSEWLHEFVLQHP